MIRTSVDHGTAFDIAGKGIANEESLIEAIDYAERLAATRAHHGAGMTFEGVDLRQWQRHAFMQRYRCCRTGWRTDA